MAALLKLPRLNGGRQIVDNAGKPTRDFTRYWDEVLQKIESQVNDIIAVQADILEVQTVQAQEIARLNAVVFANQQTTAQAQAAQQAANTAQTTADDALAAGTVSGSSLDPSVILSGAAWVNGPLVSLTGVVAGNLTITGTGPQQDGDVNLFGPAGFRNMGIEYRVQEIISGVETTVFTGNGSLFENDGDASATVSNDSAAAVAAFTSARSSTGAVDYRLDARRVSGSASAAFDLDMYLYVRRAA